jgi:hypothetical protein
MTGLLLLYVSLEVISTTELRSISSGDIILNWIPTIREGVADMVMGMSKRYRYIVRISKFLFQFCRVGGGKRFGKTDRTFLTGGCSKGENKK